MSTLPYDDRAHGEERSGYAAREASRSEVRPGERAPMGPGVVFLWVAWLIAALFWLASMRIDLGILEAVQHPTVGVAPAADMGGVGFGLMTVLGVIVLGIALAWGLARYVSRDRRMDPVTEAATANLYDSIERQGGDDLTTRSPETRAPMERDANQNVQRPIE